MGLPSEVPDKAAQSDPAVVLRLLSDFPSYSPEEEAPAKFLITAQALGVGLDATRAPLDLVAIIDTSSSMSGVKLALVQASLRFLLTQFTPRDRLCLVSFGSSADLLLPLTPTDSAGQASAQQAIGALRATGSTNLSAGLVEGLRVLHGVELNDVVATIVFTDGAANQGITSTEGLISAVEGLRKEIPKANALFTFGFGESHNPELLRALAESAAGMFYYIEGEDSISPSFAGCLGGLLSVVGQGLKMWITPGQGVSIQKCHSAFPLTNGCMNFNDIYAEERRDVLLEVVLPASPSLGEGPVLTVALDYFDCNLNAIQKLHCELRVERALPSSEPVQEPNVVLQYNRILTKNTLARILELDPSNHEEAAQLLSVAIDHLNCHLPDHPFTVALLDDLAQAKRRLASSTLSASRGFLFDSASSHTFQRATSSIRSPYTNSRSLKARFDSANFALSHSLPTTRVELDSPRPSPRRLTRLGSRFDSATFEGNVGGESGTQESQ